MNALRPLAPRRRVDLNVAVEWRLRILEPQIAFAAAEQREEDLTKILPHLREGREEELARRRVDLANRLLERLLRVGEVGALRCEKVESLGGFLVLLDGEHVYRAERFELLA